ncbi:MAG TPA: UDP-N-acetylmuramate dehydrogenase [Gammaproteobacteria bacterium]|jgi:UDP-N-acetylmuramate dehydrogenase
MSAAVNGEGMTLKLKHDEPMSLHTSWRVGGPADTFFEPASVEELQRFLAEQAGDLPLFWVGLGSNLLVRDGGIRGAVVCTLDLKQSLERLDDERVRAAAGVPCTALARYCVRAKLGPAAFFAGIPGTVGGALAMNAGAFGGETWNDVETLETIDRRGRRRQRPRADYSIGYRKLEGPAGEWFLAATFRFAPDAAADMQRLSLLVKERSDRQPIGRASCGSVFKNPPGGFAGRLIEEAGLKGASVGGASVSDKHANFIINDGTASAADIETLIAQVREEVRVRSGTELELEVKIVGEPGPRRRGARR